MCIRDSNTNNKVRDLARYGGFSLDVVKILHKYDLGMQQMDCPETLYLGIQRWQHTKNLYDNVGFRRFCRQIAVRNVDYMESYVQMGYQTVAVLSCNGSPTCGVTLTSHNDDWGGPPKDLDYGDALVEGTGVFIEELQKEIMERGILMPPFYGCLLYTSDAADALLCVDLGGRRIIKKKREKKKKKKDGVL